MLGKLMKYEYKAMGRILLPLYGMLIIVAGFERLAITLVDRSAVNEVISKMMVTLITILYVLTILAVVFATFFITIQRFYKNLLTGEGYLSFTLPVKPSQHILSKLLVSITYEIASIAVIFLSLLMMFIQRDLFRELSRIWNSGEIQMIFGGKPGLFLAEAAAIFLIGIVSGTLMFYASIAMGQKLIPNHRIAGAFASYLIINTVLQIISYIGLLFIPLSAGKIERFLLTGTNVNFSNLFTGLMLFSMIAGIIEAVVFFFLTDYLFKRHLNLE